VKTSNQWRWMPSDLPFGQSFISRRDGWTPDVFHIMVENLRSLLPEFAGCESQIKTVIRIAIPCNPRWNRAREQATTEPGAIGVKGACGDRQAGQLSPTQRSTLMEVKLE
jgi:hypothetical protein